MSGSFVPGSSYLNKKGSERGRGVLIGRTGQRYHFYCVSDGLNYQTENMFGPHAAHTLIHENSQKQETSYSKVSEIILTQRQ